MNTLGRLPHSSFLARHYKMTLNATFPSTTACALTSVATASYPNQHGVTGWFTHLPELDITILPLPFVERFSKRWLTERGLRPEDVFPLRAMDSRMSHEPLTLLPTLVGAILLVQGFAESSPLLLWGWLFVVMLAFKIKQSPHIGEGAAELRIAIERGELTTRES